MKVTIERLRELLHYNPETGVWTRRVPRRSFRAGSIAGTSTKDGYTRITIGDTSYPAHHLTWLIMTGEWPKNYIDHVNLNKTDNRWCNLREATRSQNAANTKLRKNNISGFRGVHFEKRWGRWRADFRIDGEHRFLGYFDFPEDAYAAYCAEAQKKSPEFART